MKPTPPTPAEVVKARTHAKLTQEQAAGLVKITGRRWSEYERGIRHPDWPRWQLFLLLTDQHPKARLTGKRERRDNDPGVSV